MRMDSPPRVTMASPKSLQGGGHGGSNSKRSSRGRGGGGGPNTPTSMMMAAPTPTTRNIHAAANTEKRDDTIPTAAAAAATIKDEQIQVNLAMADLMAYLQVVANNSQQLPISQRDDPDVVGIMTDLSGEDYSRKSAAFIPADVRIIGGSFLKYGNVWDLPTSEEYTALDGAQEPGRSYGGACCNSMLKVLYDAASSAESEMQKTTVDSHLFNDDDDESIGTVPFTRNDTFASLETNGQSNGSTLTWSDLLHKMKAEMADIEYAQCPTITSTRKLDLNQMFSLVPESFDKTTGTKRSLFIGCNYNSIEGAELKGSHDDIRSMKDYIVNVHGFPETDGLMKILLDDGQYEEPTFLNIVEAFKALSEQSQPGDVVFIQFSGHGGRILDAHIDPQVESYDEVLVPSDYTEHGLIRDTLIFKTLLAPMRYGVTVTIIIDCCDTGMMIDLPYSFSTKIDRKPDAVGRMTMNPDFSFVRFLKVVKTLYESSTFTQLGKTVGTALGSQHVVEDQAAAAAAADAGDMSTSDSVELEKANAEDLRPETIFQQLCLSPKQKDSSKSKKGKKSRGGGGEGGHGSGMTFFEQMLGCNFLMTDIADDISIDGTFDHVTFEDNSTFDSVSDGEGHKQSSRRSSRRRR